MNLQSHTGGASAPLRPVLKVEGLSKTFGRARVLNSVDLTVMPGEVHCLLGHNGSGKSTLIKIIGGIHNADPGARIEVNGTVCPEAPTGRQINDLGIRFVHQSLGLVPSLTVAEHFAQDRQIDGGPWLHSPARAAKLAEAALAAFDVAIPPHATIESLSAVDRALVAIVRAVASLERRPAGLAGALLILDEPTAFLPRAEVERLFVTTRRIASQGAGVILITHDTDEVLSIADRVTVLRDGVVAGVVPRADLSREGLIDLIVGHALDESRPEGRATRFAPLMQAAVSLTPEAAPVELDVGRGEILGLTGLVGSGCDDVLHALFASRPRPGRLHLGTDHIALEALTPARAIAMGMAFIPADRAGAGAALELTLAENAAILSLKELVNALCFTAKGLERATTPMLTDVKVRPMTPGAELGRLSGGNQQKVVLAKWLAMRPRLLLLEEPTQGIDVGARAQIFDLLRGLAEQGSAIVVASTDQDQLAQLCDRVLIFDRGRVTGALEGAAITSQAISEAVLAASTSRQPETVT